MRYFNTDYYNDSIMANQLVGTSFPANFPPANNLWIGLSTTVPDQAGNNITEPSGSGYARQELITSVSGSFSKLLNGLYTNNIGVQFPQPSGSWGTIQAVLAFDAQTSGNLLSVCGYLIQPALINANTPGPFFPPGALRVGIDTGWGRRGLMSEAYADAIARVLYQAHANSALTVYIALCTQVPLPSDTGSTITEANYTGYARVAVSGWTKIKPGRYGNTAAFSFAAATAGSSNIVAGAIVNASSAGELAWAGLVNPPFTVIPSSPAPAFGVNQVQIGLGQ